MKEEEEEEGLFKADAVNEEDLAPTVKLTAHPSHSATRTPFSIHTPGRSSLALAHTPVQTCPNPQSPTVTLHPKFLDRRSSDYP